MVKNCVGQKCERYQELKPWGAGCMIPTMPGDLWTSEWRALAILDKCPGAKIKSPVRGS
jgi:hypothetical protein